MLPAPQEKTVIKGKVTDSKGSPYPGVTVRIKGTNIGVVSDNDGHYELTLPAGTDPNTGYFLSSVCFRRKQNIQANVS